MKGRHEYLDQFAYKKKTNGCRWLGCIGDQCCIGQEPFDDIPPMAYDIDSIAPIDPPYNQPMLDHVQKIPPDKPSIKLYLGVSAVVIIAVAVARFHNMDMSEVATEP